MGKYILNVTAVFQLIVFALTLYSIVLGIIGLFRKKEKKNYTPTKKFACIVAAHNEEVVIANCVDSLKQLNYPRDMYDIFVIADNCTDNTADIARKHGARVFERFNKEKRGKGYALEWMFDKLFKMDEGFDAITIFDADNVVDKNFLKEMNSKMLDGFKVVQGYLDSKNPNDSWITQSYSMAFWSQNRAFQLSRSNLGLSNQIGGTGFVIDIDILKKLGWGATCLTEDLEFTCKLVLHGEQVGWAHDAIIYDEKPLKLKQSWNQRKRWMQGFTDVASRYFFKLLKKGIKERNFKTIDCALYVLQPVTTLLLGVSLILTLIQNNSKGMNIFVINYLFNDEVWRLFCMFQFILTPLYLIVDRKMSKKMFWTIVIYSTNLIVLPWLLTGEQNLMVILGANAVFTIGFMLIAGILEGKNGVMYFFRFLLYSLYTLTWIPITIQGMLDKNNKEWNHTQHVRQIEICDV
ncbi:MAG: glycosyltransferase family 2 protein [Inconstantimicrobium porci]|uniref:glycosyltransferase family 2 protein n=1 Tax=Inconstantimicrobium porci TaxID=2652291 RepID=UPI002A90C99A|nr:glycosyltransferase family 2 protein [Inconstantimicrobium porci]MDY5913188.1 glycosyltransferase family 2 protein [Inconstantimicrobium porci]